MHAPQGCLLPRAQPGSREKPYFCPSPRDLGHGSWSQFFHQLNGVGVGFLERSCQLMPSLNGEPRSVGQSSRERTVPTCHLPVLFFRGRLCTRTSATAAISELFPSRLLTRSMILSVISLIGFPSSRMSSADWKKKGQMWDQGNTTQQPSLKVP